MSRWRGEPFREAAGQGLTCHSSQARKRHINIHFFVRMVKIRAGPKGASTTKKSIHEKVKFPPTLYSSFQEKFAEIALIMDTPFVETLLVLAESWDDPGFVPGISPVCPWDKPGENLGQTRVFSLFYTVEARQNRVCPWDKPSLSLGQSRGRRAAQKVYVKKVYVPFSLAIFRSKVQGDHPDSRLWSQNARKTIARHIPESVANLLLCIICCLSKTCKQMLPTIA